MSEILFPEDQPEPRARPRDLSFEALVEVTMANVASERGQLNKALSEIRTAMPDVEDETLALEIRHRAASYRKAWPEVALTPTALAKHWSRIQMEAKEVKPRIEQPEPEGGWWLCDLCLNDAWVTISETQMAAPCPACNRGRTVEASAYRGVGFWTGKNWEKGDRPQEVVVT